MSARPGLEKDQLNPYHRPMLLRRRALVVATAGAVTSSTFLVAAVGGSCSLEGIAGAPPLTTTTKPTTTTTTKPTTTLPSTTTAAASCPSDMAPVVNVRPGFPEKTFCIDRTEVRNDAYAVFVAAVGNNPQTDPPACDWNTKYASSADGGAPDLPVVSIDWCDAYAYCAFVGKHLCGNVSNGGAADSAARDSNSDQWYVACSNNNATKYPYGNVLTYPTCNACDPTNCVIGGPADAGYTVAQAAPVGSFPGCVASTSTPGSSGPLDMSGNVWEWENACEDAGADAGGPGTDLCYWRGGSFSVTYARRQCLACASQPCGLSYGPRNTVAPDVGLRCCKELP